MAGDGGARGAAILGQAMLADPALREIEINPLISTADGAVAVDALIVCDEAS